MLTIRNATPDDIDTILGFVQELAEFEREPDAVHLTPEGLREALFGERPSVFTHIAEIGGEPVGMAQWFLTFSTWVGRHGIYVEELYVREEFRGRGVGKALLRALAEVCAERGYGRLELSVLDWNEQAIGFYRRLGFTGMDGWTVQRLAGDALARQARD